MIELQGLYEKKKFAEIYNFSEKHFPKTKIHKIITRVPFLDQEEHRLYAEDQAMWGVGLQDEETGNTAKH